MTLQTSTMAASPPRTANAVSRTPVALRVHASGEEGRRPDRGLKKCLECGAEHRKSGEFCTTQCRHGFNNRRKQRGAELYDLYMVHRFERSLAVELRILQAMNRLASNWREEDKARRDGRRSWRRAQDVLADRPYLRAIVTWDYTGRRRR